LRWWCLALLFALLGGSARATDSTLDGKIENFTSYFFDNGRLRHYRYDLTLTETSHLSDHLLTVVQGRLRSEIMMTNEPWAVGSRYSQAVRNDEQFEAEGRQVYIDYLNSQVRIRAGLQLIDWVESLTPFASDILTPYDLRWGGQGPTDEILIPVWALSANHKFLHGNLEYMAVFLPQSSRFPVGDNGYGYYPYLGSLFAPAGSVISTQPIPQTLQETEFGARYMLNVGGLDLTFLGFYGHERTPSLLVQPVNPTTLSITQIFPRVFTMGTMMAYSQDAWVGRLMAFVEPNRTPKVVGALTDPTETRLRVGGGFDYVASRHFKLYSELLGTFTQAPQISITGLPTQSYEDPSDVIATIRMTNETFHNVTLSLTTSLTGPAFSYMVSPEIAYTASRACKLALGARLLGSNSIKADFDSLKDTSAAYFTLEYVFPML
jgi:hypothetical protein